MYLDSPELVLFVSSASVLVSISSGMKEAELDLFVGGRMR